MGKNDKIATFFDGRINQRPFYKKKVVVTGHTGFKGSWLTFWLTLLGAKVIGISINIPSNPSHFKAINLEKKRSRKNCNKI